VKTAFIVLLSSLAFAAAAAQPQETPLLQAIQVIRAIDDHAHPPRVIGVGERDDDYDALPCDPLEPAPVPAKIRPDNTQYIEAWKALYGYRYNDMEPAHVREVVQAKERLKRERGDQYPNWILDQLGIETQLANRVAMGRGLAAPRFRWIAFADPLLVVRRNNTAIAYTPDRRIFYDREEKLLNRYMQALHITQMPATLNEYISSIVFPTLNAWKQQGAVGIKFEAAYLRQLSFDPTNENDAAQSYLRVMGSGSSTVADYKHVQDFLFRRIALEAGKLDLPIQIHTGGGCGSYFRLEGSNPSLLESVFNDFTLRHTKFVVLHAGWPFDRELAFLLTKPNVYADFSQVTWMLSGRELATTLRPWLEMYPEKVLFGTDLSPNTPEVDWEEIGWIASRDSRRALADVLNDLVHDGIITEQRALQYAQMVMHDNAARLYGLSGPAAATGK
jgi:predicted TIM-barrel fold metal-dependent hydrolase